MGQQQQYMLRALELAACGQNFVAPNPMVGCLVVNNDSIIGEGFHQQYGQAHAEVNALNAVKEQERIKESTLFVTLEPCAHYGKTPPCAELIAKKKPQKVVVATLDPNPKVAGKGIKIMQDAGIEVTVGLLEKEARWLNRRFFTFFEQKRPYILLKWAQTADGYIDSNQRNSQDRQDYWISNQELKKRVHAWRAQESAIFAGANTLLHDNPKLNTRLIDGKNPLKTTFLQAPINTSLHFFNSGEPSLIFNTFVEKQEAENHYLKVNAETWVEEMLQELYERKITSVLIEGGQKTLQHFIDKNLWDEARVLVGEPFFLQGLEAPQLWQAPDRVEHVGNNQVRYFYNGKK